MPVLLLLLFILVLLLTIVIVCRRIEVPSCRLTPLSLVIRSPLALLTLNRQPFRAKQYAQRTVVFRSEYNMLAGNLTIRSLYSIHTHTRARSNTEHSLINYIYTHTHYVISYIIVCIGYMLQLCICVLVVGRSSPSDRKGVGEYSSSFVGSKLRSSI